MSNLGSPSYMEGTQDDVGAHIRRPKQHTRLLSYTGPNPVATRHPLHPKSPSLHHRTSSTPDPLLQNHHGLVPGPSSLQSAADSPFFVGSDIVYGIPEPPPDVDWGFLDLDTLIHPDRAPGEPLGSDPFRVSMALNTPNARTPARHPSSSAHLYHHGSPSRPGSVAGRHVHQPDSSNAVLLDSGITPGPDSGSSSPGSAGQMRTRAQQACENCRSRKAKVNRCCLAFMPRLA